MIKSHHATLSVDLKKNIANWKHYQKLCPTAEVSAVIKADAYGVGAIPLYSALREAGCKSFWVATLDEALSLKSHDIYANVSVLGGITKDTADIFVSNNITPVLNSINQIKIWQELQSNTPVWIQFDTSMNRFGVEPSQLEAIVEILSKGNISVVGYMSHLLAGEESDNSINATQKELFDAILSELPPAKASLCNTAGTFLGREYHYDMVRIGIGLYGIPCSNSADIEFENSLTLSAPILNTRTVTEGMNVGYNQAFIAEEKMRIATVGIGYADGLNIALSNVGNVYYNGEILPIIGRISMDSMGVDISAVPYLSEGDMVTIFDSCDDISIISACADIPEHTVLATLTSRVIRKYI